MPLTRASTSKKQSTDSDDDDFQPLRKKTRFSKPTTDNEMAILSKGFVPSNTIKNTTWAFKVFLDWRAERNSTEEEEQCPRDLFDNPSVSIINYWLCRFVTEVRRQDGNPYPPKTIQQLLAGLQRKMLDANPDAPRFMDRQESCFRDLTRTCDSVYRDLHSKGVGTSVRHTSIFSSEDEAKLWETGVLADTSPKSLQRAVFYYIGKRFCIRGGEEQRKLGPSQFLRTENPDCYTYVEHGSKNRNGGIGQVRQENKCVHCYSVPDKAPQCLVFLLDLYFSKLPKYAFEKDILYCRPKTKTPLEGPWYDFSPVGRNKLGTMVKDMCQDAGIAPRTNHSLRATGATALFQANVPERIIQKTTGHRSLDSLRTYERISSGQEEAVSRVIMATEATSYKDELNKVENQQVAVRATNTENKQVKATENNQTVAVNSAGSSMGRLFGDLTNCSIGQITVNVNPTITVHHEESEDAFDEILKTMNLDFC